MRNEQMYSHLPFCVACLCFCVRCIMSPLLPPPPPVGSSSSIHPLAITNVPKDYRDSMDSKFATPEATMSRLPAWVAYDRKVLRFSGYFKEAVHASSHETWRTRKCLVYFYLEDDSMHIAEPK